MFKAIKDHNEHLPYEKDVDITTFTEEELSQRRLPPKMHLIV